MLNKDLNYTDFYRFVSSLSLGMIAAGCVLNWISIQEIYSLTIEPEVISNLTPVAQDAIDCQQQRAYFIQTTVPYGTSLLFGGGTLGLIWSLFRWHDRQGVRDTREDNDLAESDHRLEKMSGEAVKRKAKTKVVDQDDDGEQFSMTTSLASRKNLSLTLKESADHSTVRRYKEFSRSAKVKNYLLIEEQLFLGVSDLYGQVGYCQRNVRTASSEFDCIVDIPRAGTQLLFEFKYFAKLPNRERQLKVGHQLRQKAERLVSRGMDQLFLIVIFVLQDDGLHMLPGNQSWMVDKEPLLVPSNGLPAEEFACFISESALLENSRAAVSNALPSEVSHLANLSEFEV